jgi:hypothetical protein
MSPLWPYVVTTLLSLDDASPVLVDLQDYSLPPNSSPSETVQSTVRWSISGLTDTTHKLVASTHPPAAGWVEMDGLMYVFHAAGFIICTQF